MTVTEILLVVVILLLIAAQSATVLVIYNRNGEIRDCPRLFLPRVRHGLLCRLIGFIEEEGEARPIYRPLLAWSKSRFGPILEINPGWFSLAVNFRPRFPFVVVVSSGKNEKLF